LARLSELSEDEAAQLPPKARYRWAFDGFETEANDIRRGIRWRNPLKARNAARRAANRIETMESLLAREADREIAREAAKDFRHLGEVLYGGRWFRSASDAVDQMTGRVRTRLGPGVAALLESAPGAPETQAPETGTAAWIVKGKRKVLEEDAEGTRIRYLLDLESDRGSAREAEVDRDTFERARVGSPPPDSRSSEGGTSR
jgi:hypothetical protein